MVWKYFVFSTLIVIASVLYVLASYINFKFPQSNLAIAVAIASGFAVTEYCFKVPAYALVKETLKPAVIHVIWIVVAFFATNLYQRFVLGKKVSKRVWIIGVLMIVGITWLMFEELKESHA